MRVYVTQEDIDKGKREDCSACPIARAVKRMFPAFEVSSGVGDIGLYKMISDEEVGWRWYGVHWEEPLALPEVARDFVAQFDAQMPVKPFHFDIPRAEVIQ